jgi:hypothetical protein
VLPASSRLAAGVRSYLPVNFTTLEEHHSKSH